MVTWLFERRGTGSGVRRKSLFDYEEPGPTVADAATRALQAATPLDVTATAFPHSLVPVLSPPALLCLAGLMASLGVRALHRRARGLIVAEANPLGQR
jgi:hypothetical protein